MDWMMFWTAFGAIGSTIGAIATFLAVIVALWQTKISYKKKVQLSFSDDIVIATENNVFYHYVGLSITNIGNREIVLKNWGFNLNNGEKMLIIPDTTVVDRGIQVKLPYRLQIEEGVTLYYNKKYLYNVLKECLQDGTLNPNNKIKFYVVDSTAKEHYINSKKTTKELFDDLEKNNHRFI